MTPSRFRGPHIIYRCYNALGELLYAGCTVNTRLRFKRHETDSSWWPLVYAISEQVHVGRYAALRAERLAIAREHPRYNRRDTSPSMPVPLPTGKASLFEYYRPYRGGTSGRQRIRCTICGRNGCAAGPWQDACRIRHGHLDDLAD